MHGAGALSKPSTVWRNSSQSREEMDAWLRGAANGQASVQLTDYKTQVFVVPGDVGAGMFYK